MIRSALLRSLLSDGIGSKVWELIPSGMMPATSALSPATFSTMLVIGATVVTTFIFWSDVGRRLGSFFPQLTFKPRQHKANRNIRVVIIVFLCLPETAKRRAIVALPEDFHVFETGAAEPLYLLLPGRSRSIEVQEAAARFHNCIRVIVDGAYDVRTVHVVDSDRGHNRVERSWH